MVYDKQFRRVLPFYVFYEIPKIVKNSKVCAEGNVYYYFAHDSIGVNEIKDANFIKLQNQRCLELKDNFEKLYILGFSINEKDNISIELKKNFFLSKGCPIFIKIWESSF